jgi:hypothetical protein
LLCIESIQRQAEINMVARCNDQLTASPILASCVFTAYLKTVLVPLHMFPVGCSLEVRVLSTTGFNKYNRLENNS